MYLCMGVRVRACAVRLLPCACTLNRAWRHDWRIAVHGAGWAVLCHQRTVMNRHITYTCHAAYDARLSYAICNISGAHRTVRTPRSMCCHPTTLSTTSARVKRCAPSEYPNYARVRSEYPKYARVLLLPYDQLFHERCSLGALCGAFVRACCLTLGGPSIAP